MKRLATMQSLFGYCILISCFLCSACNTLSAQEFSAARIWNEMVLNAIRNDFARPTVHARNLHHTSIAMYDAFAAYDDVNETYFLGKTIGDYTCDFSGVPRPTNIKSAREEAISYAVYRLIQHRFKDSPRKENIFFNTDLIFAAFGYDKNYNDINYSSGNPADLGNYIAQSLIEYGLQDGSNEENDYANTFYEPVNEPLNPGTTFFNPLLNSGNPRLNDPNRWQELNIPGAIDQAGNLIPGGKLPFLGAEWGRVTPFALSSDDLTLAQRDGNVFNVYHDPGPPCYLDPLDGTGLSDEYKWGFSMVAHWRSHTILDSVFIDIAPTSLGNIEKLPDSYAEIREFYKFQEGGDASRGYDVNPRTGAPYEPQFVQRADYAKVVAEWWADGPSSETPPGHWFTILNYVNDQAALVKKYKGTGVEMTDLEWDVKVYFTLAGAMHDAAIAAWSLKGYYDYIRPISAIRYMIDKGQSSDPALSNYNIAGIQLVPGSIEQILDNDPQLLFDQSNYGHIKVLGNIFEDRRNYFNGNFWTPYQLPTFVTPPFAGYVSGHSTFSRAAAEVLTSFTGDEYFPGGLGEVSFDSLNYLEFGQAGPSKDMKLQWATYRDAAHQSALSRIWGGIHPPIDDIPGRKIGIKVGNAAFDLADSLFGDPVSSVSKVIPNSTELKVYPNPVILDGKLLIESMSDLRIEQINILNNKGEKLAANLIQNSTLKALINLKKYSLGPGIYHVQLLLENGLVVNKKIVVINQ